MGNDVLTTARATPSYMRVARSTASLLYLWSKQASWQNTMTRCTFLVRRATEVLRVQLSMITNRRQDQILRTVVEPITIAVVDMLCTLQRTPKYMFKHGSVFSLSFTP